MSWVTQTEHKTGETHISKIMRLKFQWIKENFPRLNILKSVSFNPDMKFSMALPCEQRLHFRGIRWRALFARQLIPRKCSLCSQGTMASHRIYRPDAFPWALAAEKVRWIWGRDKNPNFPLLNSYLSFGCFSNTQPEEQKESKNYEKRLQFQAKSTSAQTN